MTAIEDATTELTSIHDELASESTKVDTLSAKIDSLSALVTSLDLTADQTAALNKAIADVKSEADEIGSKEDTEIAKIDPAPSSISSDQSSTSDVSEPSVTTSTDAPEAA